MPERTSHTRTKATMFTTFFPVSPSCLPGCHQGAQASSPFWSAQLAKGFGFDLADTFPSDVELLADFFQGVLALAADSEAQTDHLLFLWRKSLEDAGRLVAD